MFLFNKRIGLKTFNATTSILYECKTGRSFGMMLTTTLDAKQSTTTGGIRDLMSASNNSMIRASSLFKHQPKVSDQVTTTGGKAMDPKHPYGEEEIKVNEIKLRKQRKTLELHMDVFTPSNGTTRSLVITLPAELLRVESPSAEVQGEDGRTRLVFAKKFVEIKQIEMVGTYAIRLIFSDGHDTGIYSWKYLFGMGQQKYTLMKQYIQDLRIAGRSRYPRAYLKQQEAQKTSASATLA